MFSVLKPKIWTCTNSIFVTYPFLTKSLRHICFWNLSISYLNNILDQLNIMINPVSKHGWVYYYLCKIFMQILMIDYEGKILYVDFLLTIYILSLEVRKCFRVFWYMVSSEVPDERTYGHCRYYSFEFVILYTRLQKLQFLYSWARRNNNSVVLETMFNHLSVDL